MVQAMHGSLQENCLALLAHSDEAGKLVFGLVQAELFEGEYKVIAERVIDYWKRHGSAPKIHSSDLFADILGDPNNRKAPTYRRILMQMMQLSVESLNTKYIVGQLSKFVRLQRMKDATFRSAERLHGLQETAIEEIEEIWNDLLRERQSSFEAGTRLHQIDSVLNLLEPAEFSTGIREFNRRGIVPARGTVFLMLAAAKRGKCIAAGQLVMLPDGSRKLVERVVKDRDPYVLALNEENGELQKAKVTDWLSNGKKQCFMVTTSTGRQIITTKDHPLLTPHGWRPVSKLQIRADYVAVPLSLANWGSGAYSFERLRLLAYLIADGSLRNGDTGYSKQDPAILADFVACVRSVGDDVSFTNPTACYVVRTGALKRHKRSCETRRWLDELGLINKRSREKFVPEFVFRLDDQHIREFLRALLSSDGSLFLGAPGKGPTFEYCSASSRLVEDVRHLLLRFGVVAKIQYFTARFKDKELPGYAKLVIRGAANVTRFLTIIGLFGGKGDRVAEVLAVCRSLKGVNVPRKMRGYSADVVFDRVTRIEPVGRLPTYDLSVECHHNFVVSDFVVHNSWWLVDLGRRALQQRKKVVHISLEMSEERVLQRYYQNMFSIPKRDVEFVMVPHLERDKYGRLTDFYHVKVEPQFSLDFRNDPRRRETVRAELEARINPMGARLENLIIKQFPPRSLTANGLRAYLDNLEIVEKFIPDLCVLDYLGIMHTDANNHRISLGRVGEEFRAIQIERNMAGVSCLQITREGAQAPQARETHVAEDWTQIATGDTITAFSATDAEFKFGLGRMFVTNARDEADRWGVLVSQNYGIGQFVIDSVPLDSRYWECIEELRQEGKWDADSMHTAGDQC